MLHIIRSKSTLRWFNTGRFSMEQNADAKPVAKLDLRLKFWVDQPFHMKCYFPIRIIFIRWCRNLIFLCHFSSFQERKINLQFNYIDFNYGYKFHKILLSNGLNLENLKLVKFLFYFIISIDLFLLQWLLNLLSWTEHKISEK